MAWQISNVPLHLKPSPTYLGIQEQLYDPCVLVQEAFGWHLLISTACASLHSSTSEREHTYYVKIKAQKNVTRRLRKLTVTKFGTCNLWTPMFLLKRANVSSKFGRQRRDVIKIQLIIKYSKKSKVRMVKQRKQFHFLILKQNCHRCEK